MSVTIELDCGVKVTADTLKEAQRLAKKELVKQRVAEKEKDKKADLARLHCYAQIGHWADYLDSEVTLPAAHVPIPKGTVYADSCFRRHVTSKDNGDTLRIESPDGNAEWNCYGYRIVALIENSAGFLIGAKLQAVNDDGSCRVEAPYYIATYAVDDVASVAQVPKFIGVALDRKMNARLAAAAVSF